jgi:hypothetical protein
MRCPYCAGQMKPCGSVSYSGGNGLRVADWVRCVRCEHATIAQVRSVFKAKALSSS